MNRQVGLFTSPWRAVVMASILLAALGILLSVWLYTGLESERGKSDRLSRQVAEIARDKAIKTDRQAKARDRVIIRRVNKVVYKLGQAGVRGLSGKNGTPGPPGIEGAKGERGDPGPPPSMGQVAGAVAAYCSAHGGCEGPRGADGKDGEQGPKGDKGDKGDQGNPGAQGAQGEQGPPPSDEQVDAAVQRYFATHSFTCTQNPENPSSQTCTANP